MPTLPDFLANVPFMSRIYVPAVVLLVLASVIFGGYVLIVGFDYDAESDMYQSTVFKTECIETTNDSCYWNGMDQALVGETWTLISQTLTSPAGEITNPFSGHTLTFSTWSDPGTNGFDYTQDYSTEKTDDVTFNGTTSTCEVTGVLNGKYFANYSGNLEEPVVVDKLQITPDGGSPQVKCDAGGSQVTGNSVSTPLGVGPLSPSGGFVLYNYTVVGDTLTIVQENPYALVVLTSVYQSQ